MTSPFEHPWLSGLFGDAEAAEIWGPTRQMTHMISFERAYTQGLCKIGTISEDIAKEVARTFDDFQPDMEALRSATARDGVVVPELVRQIRGSAGSHGEAIHSGATSQDVIDTALVLTLKDYSNLLERRLLELTEAIDALSARFENQRIMGRTRMQAAMPIAARERFLTWSLPLDDHRQRLSQIRPRIERLQLGGAAGDRAALPHAESLGVEVALRVGLANPPKAWHAMRDPVVDYAGLLSLISGTLGKMGQDICLMAQQGVDEIALDNAGGSSAMPHKQNPVLAELLVTLARFNATQVSAMHQGLVHEQERSGAAWALEWMGLPQMAQATARSLAASTEICQAISHVGSKDIR